jgi:predicted GIY-YIG superfamily endonuclease
MVTQGQTTIARSGSAGAVAQILIQGFNTAVGEKQLHLIPPSRPLLERFGHGFFRGVPARPGVYIMAGDAGTVLYIGQSKNLRARLCSYKNALPDRAPRKVIRLIHCVRSIVWEECPSPEGAILRENHLLRTHRPRFNRMNTYPKAYGFIIMESAPDGFILRRSHDAEGAGQAYGAFKSGWIFAHGALLRLFWAVENRPSSPGDFPIRLLQPNPPRQYQVRFTSSSQPCGIPGWSGLLAGLLAGESELLLAAFESALPSADGLHPFLKNLFASDLELLKHFYLRGPVRNRCFASSINQPGPLIPQESLDDFMATFKFSA